MPTHRSGWRPVATHCAVFACTASAAHVEPGRGHAHSGISDISRTPGSRVTEPLAVVPCISSRKPQRRGNSPGRKCGRRRRGRAWHERSHAVYQLCSAACRRRPPHYRRLLLSNAQKLYSEILLGDFLSKLSLNVLSAHQESEEMFSLSPWGPCIHQTSNDFNDSECRKTLKHKGNSIVPCGW